MRESGGVQSARGRAGSPLGISEKTRYGHGARERNGRPRAPPLAAYEPPTGIGASPCRTQTSKRGQERRRVEELRSGGSPIFAGVAGRSSPREYFFELSSAHQDAD